MADYRLKYIPQTNFQYSTGHENLNILLTFKKYVFSSPIRITTTTGKVKRGKMFGKPLILKQKSKGNVK